MQTSNDFKNSLKFQSISNGETIAYRSQIRVASKANFILVHGWISSSLVMWNEIVSLLSDLSLSFYAVDLRGFGDSSYNKSIKSIEDFAEDIHLFAKALGLNDLIVAGYSMGGAVALQFAANYPENLRKLILFDSVGSRGVLSYYEKDGQQVQIVKTEDLGKSGFWDVADMKFRNDIAGASGFLQLGTFNAGKQPTAEVLRKYVVGFEKERNVTDCLYWLTHWNITNESNGVVDGNGKINNIKCKCLILHGDQDRLIDVKESELTAQALGKLAKLEIVADSGHCPVMSQPEKTAALIKVFFADI
jgi:pimeloyl-ACP methyl ester carboxylesterase